MTLPYYRSTGNVLENTLKKHSAYKSTTIDSRLYKDDKQQEKLKNSEVYEAICDCGAVYIGQTARNVGIRIKKHFARPKESKIAEHLQKTGHTQNDFTVKLLHKEVNFGKRIILEHIEINKMIEKNYVNKSLILNDQLTNSLNKIYTRLFPKRKSRDTKTITTPLQNHL